MLANVIMGFGDSSLLHTRRLPMPECAPDEVLVQTAFAGVNPVDWQMRDGWFRHAQKFRFPMVLGWDVYGQVVGVGSAVGDRYAVGDNVYANCRVEGDLSAFGAYAEYVAVKASSCARPPSGVSGPQVSVLPVAALTALQSFQAAEVVAGADVLVLGANGAVASHLMSLLRQVGAAVTAAAQPSMFDDMFCQGATAVVDSRALSQRRDADGFVAHRIVFDCGAGVDVDDVAPWLSAGGRFVTIVKRPNPLRAQALGLTAMHVFVRPDGDQLTEVSRLVETGVLKVPSVEVVGLAHAGQAHDKIKSGYRQKHSLSIR